MAEESALRKTIREIVDPFKSLAGSPQALWALYISYWLEGLVYFGILTVLGKYLSESVGMADLHAGWVYSGFTGGITLAMLFLGGVADRMGVRRALLLSLGFMVIGRFLLGASGVTFEHGQGASSGMFILVTAGLAVVVLGYGIYQPAAYAAVKQFTDEKTSTMGYAMIYGLMNLGAFFSGIISPAVRKSVGPKLGSLLGVPVSQDMGIAAVLVLYVGLTLLAFLAIWVLMTKTAVERATLTNIEASKEPDDEIGSVDGRAANGTEARNAAAEAKLFTPSFMLFTGGAVVATVAVIVLAVSAPRLPGEEAFAEARAALKKTEKALEGEKATPEMSAAIKAVADELASIAERPAAPANLPEGDKEDAVLAEDLAATLASDAVVLRDLSPLLTETWRQDKESEALRDGIREMGIALMGGAYALVSPVDDEVLDNLCVRMKEAGAEPVPLSDSTRVAILGLANDAPRDMVRGLVDLVRETLSSATQNDSAAGAAIALMIAEKMRVIEGLVSDGAGDLPPAQEALLSEHLLHGAVFFLKGLPSLLVAKDDNKDEDKTKKDGRVLITAWLSAEVDLTRTLEEIAPGVVQVSTKDRLVRWGTRYGLLLAAAVLFLFLLGRSLLRKRPDHPFNDVRFVFFIFVLIPVQTLFAHNWLTLPYYIDRAFGGTTVGDNFEFFSNINPILIFFLAPAVAALTAKAKVYPMMIWGTLVMAAPTFLLTLPPSPTMLLTYILLMSIGEAMWQPRFLQWVAEIAPEGQTGLYMGIGQFPWFLTKVLTGLYSGYFLARYCPMVGPQNTQTMWLFYALIAMVSPIALWLARGWMRGGAGRKALG